MNGMAWPQGKLKFATKLLPNCSWGVRYVVGIIGGPDRDRTDDLFHAMEARSQLRHRPTVLIVNCCTRLRQLKLVGFSPGPRSPPRSTGTSARCAVSKSIE